MVTATEGKGSNIPTADQEEKEENEEEEDENDEEEQEQNETSKRQELPSKEKTESCVVKMLFQGKEMRIQEADGVTIAVLRGER